MAPLSPHQFPPITADEARGDSQAVTPAKFQATAQRGAALIQHGADNASPPEAMHRQWGKLTADAYKSVQEPWGGITADTHTGQHVAPDADKYAVTARSPGQEPVKVGMNPSPLQFSQAMNNAQSRFHDQLSHEGAHLGVFRDDDIGEIHIDPTRVLSNRKDSDAVGAASHAVGGAYHFKSGNGAFAPHVKGSGSNGE
jgi:hypothetical protein